jgi:hypothetical protein
MQTNAGGDTRIGAVWPAPARRLLERRRNLRSSSVVVVVVVVVVIFGFVLLCRSNAGRPVDRIELLRSSRAVCARRRQVRVENRSRVRSHIDRRN